jgi:DNA topoisomerase-1
MPDLLSKAKDAANGPKNPEFEAMHPRDRSGRDKGEFIDVPNIMAALGGNWDEKRGVWMVPADKRADLDQFAKDTGFEMMNVPEGMRPANQDDLAKKWQGAKIPPAWTDVLVSDDPKAQYVVIGRDAKGRIQRIRTLHATQQADAAKFARIKLLDFVMPVVDAKLEKESMTSDTAAAMLLIRKMGLRPGSKTDTGADVQAFGASTLQRRHVQVTGDTVRLSFVGKEGVQNDLSIEDAHLAKVLKHRLKGKAGTDPIFSTNEVRMNRWVKDATGGDFKVKDFRTHLATGEARAMVDAMPPPLTAKQHRAQQLAVSKHVSSILGNKPKQALTSYIDPSVFGPVPADKPTVTVPGEDGRSALVAAFEQGFDEGAELTGGNTNLSIKRVTLSDGTHAVWKRPQNGGEHRREILSGLVANALGLDGWTADAGDGQLLTTFHDGAPGAYAGFLKDGHSIDQHVTLEGAREIGVLDWLIRNRDRHDLNYIVQGDRVRPIDHGLTFFTSTGADNDIPRSPFASHWLGLTQKPTPRPAMFKTHDEGAVVKGPKPKLNPKVSKAYVKSLMTRLEAGRSEFSDDEWAGLLKRLDLLMQAAPDTIPGETKLEEAA